MDILDRLLGHDRYTVLKSSDAVVGGVGLVPAFGSFEALRSFGSHQTTRFTAEMGLFWAIAPAHRGRGYATEAAAALIGFAFDHLNAARLIATTEHDNAASIAVMRKLGMAVQRNPYPQPQWFQTVGVLDWPSEPNA